MTFLRHFSFLSVFVLMGCSGPSDKLEYIERPVEIIYNQAFDEFESGNFRLASEEFDEVERQHPYSIWARRAMVMSAYSYYRHDKYEDAIATAERFLTLYPGNKNAAYAYYLIAMCYYEQISDVRRDQHITELAHRSFKDVMRLYPDTSYARDALLKVDFIVDHLAGKEMDVGRFYLRRGDFSAAASRFSEVIRHYSRTSHAPEALHRLVEVYLSLGLIDEARDSAAVLGHNFPDSAWYRDSYRILVARDLTPQEDKSSWIGRSFDRLF